MSKIWEGRIGSKTDSAVDDFTYSIDIDRSLYLHDMTGTAAYVAGLEKIGVINRDELKEIMAGLMDLKEKIEKGNIDYSVHEDIHSLIESELHALIGEPALKIHTGRSRNDQIVLDERLFCKDMIINLLTESTGLMAGLLKISDEQIDTIFPAYTHLQKAQPVSLAHYMLSFFDKFARDNEKLIQAFESCDHMPLGAAACAGSGYKIDRDFLADILKFKNLASNSMDIVGSRDFMIDLIYACSMIMMHLSRFSEDLIIYNSDEFSYIDIEGSFCTGSSIMPQKKNPDLLELIRGKSSLVIGNLMQIMIMLKALPSTYNRDLQEDKKILFDAAGETVRSISIFAKLIENISFNKKIIINKLENGFLEATDMADYLVEKGESFRNSHHITGNIVKYCIEKNIKISGLTLDELKKHSHLFAEDIYERIELESCLKARDVDCGTSKISVADRIKKAEEMIGSFRVIIGKLKKRTADFESIIDIAG